MGQDFITIARNIIDDAIESAIYIDDEISVPFEEKPDIANFEFCKNIYTSFCSNNTSIDFFRFNKFIEWNKKADLLLKGKDLLILDWLLDDPNDSFKYEAALKILDKAIHTDSLHFVNIYSNEQNDSFKNIFFQIRGYFYGITNDKKRKVNELLSEFIESSLGLSYKDIKLQIASKLKDLIFATGKNGIIINEIDNILKKELGEDKKEFDKILENEFHLKTRSDLYQNLAFILNDGVLRKQPLKLAFDYFTDEGYFVLNNTIIQVSFKGERKPIELFDKFRDVLISSTRNYLTLMALEMRNLFRKTSSFIGKDIKNIDELAFFFHKKQIRPEYLFYDFLKEIWKDQSSSFLYQESYEPQIFSVIDTYQSDKKIKKRLEKALMTEEFNEDLARLNCYYNVLHIKRKKNDKIKFGDIFEIIGDRSKFLLCITAHCDCLYADKINNNFYFVEGNKSNLNQSLIEGDTGFNSFLQDFNNEPFSISWKNKPITLHIPDEKNNISKAIKIGLKTDTFDIKYLITLKENYVQRIANKAFTYPLHVGISFADRKDLKD